MVKIMFLLIMTIFLNMLCLNNINAQPLFGYLPPNEISRIDNSFELNGNVSIDSINTQMSKKTENRLSYNATAICFTQLNENEIDSIVEKIDFKKFIVIIEFYECPIKIIPESIRELRDLSSIIFTKCDSINSLNGFNSVQSIFGLYFNHCKINRIPDGVENLKPMIRLMLDFPNDFNGFDVDKELLKFNRRKNIIDLFIFYKLLNDFPESIFNLTSLQTLVFYTQNIKDYPPSFDKLFNLMHLVLTNINNNAVNSVQKNLTFNYYLGVIFPDDSNIDLQISRIMDWEKFMMYRDGDSIPYAPYLIVLNQEEMIDKKFPLGNSIVTIKQDSNKKVLKINISDLNIKDKVKIILTEPVYEKIKPILNLDYLPEGIIIDMDNYPGDFYFLKIRINNIVRMWHLRKL